MYLVVKPFNIYSLSFNKAGVKRWQDTHLASSVPTLLLHTMTRKNQTKTNHVLTIVHLDASGHKEKKLRISGTVCPRDYYKMFLEIRAGFLLMFFSKREL